jgi:two-component system chemotaxis response regulator CheB
MSLRPDAITLDLEMPRMDGFTFLRILMSKQPTPVIVISSYSQKENVFKALELGAIDFVAKPDRQFQPEPAIRLEIVQKVKLIRFLKPAIIAAPARAAAKASTDAGKGTGSDRPSRTSQTDLMTGQRREVVRHVIAIASSTGGPTALLDLFARLPERFPGSLLIAQHMPDKFTRTFAERLDKKGNVRVTEAVDGELLLARRAYVCPGGMCLEAHPGAATGEIRLRVGQPTQADRYIPSADRLFRTVAAAAGTRSVGIVLTGMGDDGAVGAKAIRAAGGTVVAESEETAVVYGMPAAAVRSGAVNESLSLPEISEFLSLLT